MSKAKPKKAKRAKPPPRPPIRLPDPKTGRPWLITPKRIQQIAFALEVGASMKDAAHYAGLSDRVVHKWLALGRVAMAEAGYELDEIDADVLEAVPDDSRIFVQLVQACTEGRAKGTLLLLGSLHRAALGGEVLNRAGKVVGYVQPQWRAASRAVAFRGEEYQVKKQVEHTGSLAGRLVVHMPPEDEPPEETTPTKGTGR